MSAGGTASPAGTEAADSVGSGLAPRSAKEKPHTSKPTMRVKIYSPFKTYFDEDGYSLSGTNATGPFDILPHHHNFMSLLIPGELVVRPVRGGEQRLRISGGLMHVKSDRVIVFLDI